MFPHDCQWILADSYVWHKLSFLIQLLFVHLRKFLLVVTFHFGNFIVLSLENQLNDADSLKFVFNKCTLNAFTELFIWATQVPLLFSLLCHFLGSPYLLLGGNSFLLAVYKLLSPVFTQTSNSIANMVEKPVWCLSLSTYSDRAAVSSKFVVFGTLMETSVLNQLLSSDVS